MAATDTAPTSPPDPPSGRPSRDSRRRNLLIGTVIGLVALAAAIGAALLTGDVTEGEDEGGPVGLGEVLEDPPTSGLVSEDTSGDRVPTGQVDNLAGGKLSLADYAGRPMVVNFFGSWCVPCRKEMPDLQRVHEAYGDRVAFVGIAVNDTARDARAFMEELGATYDAGLDSGGDLYPAFGSAVMPTTALVSSDGRIVKVVAGAVTAERLQELIRDELGA